MLASHIGQRLLWVTAGIMAGFAAPVVVGAVAAARTGGPPRRILAKYLTWFLIISPIVLPLAFSGVLFQGVVLLLSLQCVREFARATGLSRDRPAAAACYVLTAAVYACVLAGWDGAHRAAPAWVVAALLLLAALVAVLGSCGDLVVSVIKRDVGVKDMGRALPGHGGVLDRCDSLILAAPAFFHVVRWLTGA